MDAKYKDLNTVWKVMDVRQMDGLLDNSFDYAIDKATMDSMWVLFQTDLRDLSPALRKSEV